MLTKRIIPCLDIKEGRVVKGVNFINLKDAGDPTEIADGYSKHVNNLLARKMNKNKEFQVKQAQMEKELTDLENSLEKYKESVRND